MKSKRKFSREFKQTAIRQMAGGKSAAELARALEVHSSDLYRWRRELSEHGAEAFAGQGRKRFPTSVAGTGSRVEAPARRMVRTRRSIVLRPETDRQFRHRAQ
jgi:transposase-like protein